MGRFTSIILCTLAFIWGLTTLFGSNGLLQLNRMDQEYRALERKNLAIESEIRGLENRIYALEKDTHFLEASSREQLGLSKAGEIVYIFNDAPRSDSTTTVSREHKRKLTVEVNDQ
jgi:cell division protein FtsB